MKSAYELAMERLEKNQPSVALTAEQKQQIAEIDSSYKAKVAEKELLLRDEIRKARAAGNFEEAEKVEQQLASEIKRLRDDCDAKKEKLRASFKAS
jgi:Spy/CpxP family protein refolding chaperone